MGWIYQEGIKPEDYLGVVYLITNKVTGKAYVGKKKIWSESKGKLVKINDWETYWGSCKPLLDDIAQLGEQNFERRVLHWCLKAGELNYLEAKEQFLRDVLVAKLVDGSRAYYNSNILVSFNDSHVINYVEKRQEYVKEHQGRIAAITKRAEAKAAADARKKVARERAKIKAAALKAKEKAAKAAAKKVSK